MRDEAAVTATAFMKHQPLVHIHTWAQVFDNPHNSHQVQDATVAQVMQGVVCDSNTCVRPVEGRMSSDMLCLQDLDK